MRKLFIAFMILFASLFVINSVWPRMEISGRTDSSVNDYAGIIDGESKIYLEDLISSIDQKTPDPIELIITTFNSIEGWGFGDFAREYGEKWREIKRGRRDNGIILLIVLQEQRVTLGVGRNLEGVITHKISAEIINDVIIPEFRKGEYVEGIKKGAEAIVKLLNKADIPAGNPYAGAAIILIAALIISAIFLIKRLRQKAS